MFMATNKNLIAHAEAFMLHAIPYKETSLIAELFTRDYGRVSVVARGAKRPHSALRSVLLPFQPVLVSYQGRHQLRVLVQAQWSGPSILTVGPVVCCGFYLNELLIRLLPREDPAPALYDRYMKTLISLVDEGNLEEPLRRFEWYLLQEIGYAPDLARDAYNQPIQANGWYLWQPGKGFVSASSQTDRVVQGELLHRMASNSFDPEEFRQDVRALMRWMLSHYLGGAVLHSRYIFQELIRMVRS